MHVGSDRVTVHVSLWTAAKIDRFWQNKFPPKSRYGVQTRLRALLEPTINKKRKSNK